MVSGVRIKVAVCLLNILRLFVVARRSLYTYLLGTVPYIGNLLYRLVRGAVTVLGSRLLSSCLIGKGPVP